MPTIYFKQEHPFIYYIHGEERKMIKTAKGLDYYSTTSELRILVGTNNFSKTPYIWLQLVNSTYIINVMTEVKVAFRFKSFKKY